METVKIILIKSVLHLYKEFYDYFANLWVFFSNLLFSYFVRSSTYVSNDDDRLIANLLHFLLHFSY
jgi:hypothetical protein